MLGHSRSHYRALQARAIAFTNVLPADAAQQFWTWIVAEQSTDVPASGYEEVLSVNDERFIMLCSHLSQTLHIVSDDNNSSRIYARTIDLDYATRYPVMLAFSAPATAIPQRAEELEIGRHGIVLDNTTLYMYSVDQLGESSKELCSQIHETLLLSLQATSLEQDASSPFPTIIEDIYFGQAHAAAKQLAQHYWSFHLSQSQKTTPDSASQPRPLPVTTNIMRGGAIIPASALIEGVLLAYSGAQSNASKWVEIEHVPTFVHEQESSTTSVQLRPQQGITAQDEMTRQLWEQIRTFSDLDGDVLLAMLAQMIAAPRDEKKGVWITTQNILEYRGIQPKTHRELDGTTRTAGHRFEDMEDIESSVSRIRDTHVTVRQWKETRRSKKSQQTKKRMFQQESYLFTISDFILQSQLVEEGTAAKEALQIAWFYQAGSCLEMFLAGDRKVAWLLQQALRYDYYHEMWEKRLARYFTFQLRMNEAFGGVTITRQIGTLIDELSLPVNRSDPEKTRARFEKAMNRLKEHGIITDWGPEEVYQEAMRTRPARKWLDVWLRCEIQITAAPLTPSLAEDSEVSKERRISSKLEKD